MGFTEATEGGLPLAFEARLLPDSAGPKETPPTRSRLSPTCQQRVPGKPPRQGELPSPPPSIRDRNEGRAGTQDERRVTRGDK